LQVLITAAVIVIKLQILITTTKSRNDFEPIIARSALAVTPYEIKLY